MQDQRQKPGRKPKPQHELRQHPVTCRLTDAEAEHIDRVRGAITRGEWLRRAALGKLPRIVPEINREAWAELARTAANLNQYQRAVNQGQVPAAPFDLVELRAQVQQLRAAMIGIEDDEGEDQ